MSSTTDRVSSYTDKAGDKANAALGTAEEQIARLRSQVESLMKDRVTPAIAAAADRAESALHSATDTVRSSTEAVSGRVQQQPLVSVLIAAGIGYLLGRAMR